MSKPKKVGGRPPLFEREAMPNPIAVRLPRKMIEQIHAIMAVRMDEPDQSTVIRELIAKGLAP